MFWVTWARAPERRPGSRSAPRVHTGGLRGTAPRGAASSARRMTLLVLLLWLQSGHERDRAAATTRRNAQQGSCWGGHRGHVSGTASRAARIDTRRALTARRRNAPLHRRNGRGVHQGSLSLSHPHARSHAASRLRGSLGRESLRRNISPATRRGRR